jgi:hypothetical protein
VRNNKHKPVARGLTWNWPAAQAAQASPETYEPALQKKVGAKVGATTGIAVGAGTGARVGTAKHEDAPSAEDLPPAQALQATAPVLDWYHPTEQPVQSLALADPVAAR